MIKRQSLQRTFLYTLIVGYSFLLAGFFVPAHAQESGNEDTRWRLEQNLDKQETDNETELLEEADTLNRSLTIDGKQYTVANTVSDIGAALYVSIMRKNWAQANHFLEIYEPMQGIDPMLLLYAKGALARADRKLDAAESYYKKLNALQPDFLPGQLELARTLFENYKESEARRLFQAIQSRLKAEGGKAERILITVDGFLKALSRRLAWHGSLTLGIGYSDNLNQSSASYTCLLTGEDGTCLFDRKVPDPIKATGISFEGNINRRFPLGGHSGLRFRTFAYGAIYPSENEYSQITMSSRLGYEYRTARNSFSVSPQFETGTLGSDILYTTMGINADWTHTLSRRAILKLEANHRRFNYQQLAYEVHDGGLTDTYLTVWYGLPAGWSVFGGPDIAFKNAESAVNAYHRYGGRVGLDKKFGTVIDLMIIASYKDKKYRAYSETLAMQRHDTEQNYTALLKLTALKVVSLVPQLSLQHYRVTSNVDWLYSYHRTTASLRFNYAF